MVLSSYQAVALSINKTVGRQAVTVKKLQGMARKAKLVRKNQGQLALIAYGKQILQQIFSANEIESLKRSNQYKPIILKLVQLLVEEKVVSTLEAALIKRYL